VGRGAQGPVSYNCTTNPSDSLRVSRTLSNFFEPLLSKKRTEQPWYVRCVYIHYIRQLWQENHHGKIYIHVFVNGMCPQFWPTLHVTLNDGQGARLEVLSGHTGKVCCCQLLPEFSLLVTGTPARAARSLQSVILSI
jgi:hypothetical protein